MIEISTKSSDTTTKALKKLVDGGIFSDLDRYGRMGVAALARATPASSGITANSWGYRVIKSRRFPGIEWYNTNTNNGTPIAVLIQYGHSTGTGGWVPGRDFINPALRPVFDEISADVWKRVQA